MKIKEDTGEKIFQIIKDIEIKLKKKNEEIKSKNKNSQLHLMIETQVINKLKEDAKTSGFSLSEYCRRKLTGDNQLDRIEKKIDKLGTINDNR